MSDAIQNWIADLQANTISQNDQPMVANIATVVAALNEIETAVGGGPYLPLAGGTMSGNILGLNASSFSLNVANAAATVPTLIPNRASAGTGIGAQAAGNFSGVVSGAELWRTVGTGFTMIAGAITPVSTSGIVGTITNDNANAGSVGELIKASVVTGSSVALTPGVPANVTTISLTAGDWDVSGKVAFNGTSGASAYGPFRGGINTVSATLPSTETESYALYVGGTGVLASSAFLTCGTLRISISATTTVYLVAQNDAVAGVGAYGTLRARRVR